MTHAKKGDHVTVHYTGRLADGTIFDSSEGHDPLSCILGNEQVIPGFEEAIIGMSQGESKTVTIPKDKAYGPHDKNKVIKVSPDQIPANIQPEVGMQLQVMNDAHHPLMVRVTEITEEHVALDANPPLAGHDLVFDIQLVTINA